MPSLRARLLSSAMRRFYKPRVGRGTIEEQRREFEQMMKRDGPPRGTVVEPVVAADITGERLTPPGGSADRVLYYLHGGWHYMGSTGTHRGFVGRLARSVGVRALVVNYRLAPEHPFPAGVDDAVAVYRWLLANGVSAQSIVVAGDSAGGGLCLATLLRLRDEGVALPAGAVLISPWTDLAMQGASMRTHAASDPMFVPAQVEKAAALYVGSADAKDPKVSPVYADLRGLPPLLVQVGGDEILLDDSTRLAAGASEGNVTLKVWEGLFHDFQMLKFLPEAKQAVAEIGAFARQCYGLEARA
jgi:acetyl esterase/lipase